MRRLQPSAAAAAATAAAASSSPSWLFKRAPTDYPASTAFASCHLAATTSGVSSVDANLETQKVTVGVEEGGPAPEDMLAALQKWGENANKTVALAE